LSADAELLENTGLGLHWRLRNDRDWNCGPLQLIEPGHKPLALQIEHCKRRTDVPDLVVRLICRCWQWVGHRKTRYMALIT
jgi:hypothetical protein